MVDGELFKKLKSKIYDEKRLVEKIGVDINKGFDGEEFVEQLRGENSKFAEMLDMINMEMPEPIKPMVISQKTVEKDFPLQEKIRIIDRDRDKLEREVIKRLKNRKETFVKIKERKPSEYIRYSNAAFGGLSLSLYNKSMFKSLKKDLVQANLSYLPVSYISVVLFTTMISFVFSIFLMIFLLFFNVTILYPFLSMVKEDIVLRFVKVFWIIFAIPGATFFLMYIYPSMERKSLSNKIEQELPFVMINMSAIAGSKIEPSKMFEIIVSTEEFPHVSREFTKVINEVHIYGYDLVSALRESAANTSSKRLSEVFNSLATTITSGGDMAEFFDERAKTLLFDYRLERERYTRSAETFMDIYISVVIAAPMILMLLLMMIKTTNLGLTGLTTGSITLIMVLGVSGLNILFITYLYLKQPGS